MAHPHILPPSTAQYRQDAIDVQLAHAPKAYPCPSCGWAMVAEFPCPTCMEGVSADFEVPQWSSTMKVTNE